jgi:phosphoribulokinase
VNVAELVDLLVGVVPIVNLEWIQKIHRDNLERGYSAEAIVDTILRRMEDYINYITPQFSRSHINFQRVPTVDTSNPFIARDIPTPDESFVVIRFSDPKNVDFPYFLSMIHDSFMSRPNTIVIPGGKMGFAMEVVLTPLIQEMIENKKK